jgi:hypothetical protein
MHKHFIVASAIFLFSGCKMQEKTYHANLNDVADEYVKLTLAIGEYDPDFIDAYYGPEEWRPSGAKKEHFPYEEFKWQANDLINQLKEIDDAAFEHIEMQRYGFLIKQLHAVQTKLDMMAGKQYPFDVESLALYDAVAPHVELSTFETLLEELEFMVPGEGPLAVRYIAYSKKFVIPADKLDTVFQTAILEARARTKHKIDLPENERLEIQYVKDQPWEAYNTYQGNAHSLIRINTDLPYTIDWALFLAAHEGYPGHHVYNISLEQHLVIDRQWSEYQVQTFFSPQSFIAEGTANFGVGMIFNPEQRLAFEKEVLFPLAGINSESAEQFYQVQEIRNQLAFAEISIARAYLNRSLSAEEAIEALKRYKQYTEEEATQRISFFDNYRSYVINFTIGEQLVKDHIDEAGADVDEQWALFKDLLSTPYTASGL